MDNLTEELEENPESTVYDDYKFVTKKDLENLGKRKLQWNVYKDISTCFEFWTSKVMESHSSDVANPLSDKSGIKYSTYSVCLEDSDKFNLLKHFCVLSEEQFFWPTTCV